MVVKESAACIAITQIVQVEYIYFLFPHYDTIELPP